MEFYWEIEQYDGTKVSIPPSAVATVKKRMDAKDPIHTSTGSIPANQIKTFRITERRYSNVPLLDSAAQAFNEPVYNESGAVMCRWVKKTVPQQMYQKHYSAIPAYRRLGEMNGMVVVAFRLAIQDINPNMLDYCSDSEIHQLTGE